MPVARSGALRQPPLIAFDGSAAVALQGRMLSLNQPAMFESPSLSRYVRKAAPAITPHTLPIPPRMTMQRMKIEKLKGKRSGKTPCLNDPYQAPARPPKNAPAAYAHVFVRI